MASRKFITLKKDSSITEAVSEIGSFVVVQNRPQYSYTLVVKRKHNNFYGVFMPGPCYTFTFESKIFHFHRLEEAVVYSIQTLKDSNFPKQDSRLGPDFPG